MEVLSYLKCEMKIPPSEIAKLNIVKIFAPSKDDWNTLYVEFGSEFEVGKLFGYTRVMIKQDHRVVRWYPKQIFDRYMAVDKISYEMRLDMKKRDIKLKTRVKVGIHDLELSSKLPYSTVWRNHTLQVTCLRLTLTQPLVCQGHLLHHQAGQAELRCWLQLLGVFWPMAKQLRQQKHFLLKKKMTGRGICMAVIMKKMTQ